MAAPAQPKIYHIVHIDNLASIVADGCLWSDAVMIQRQGGTVIGMGGIKQRRLGLPVSCHDGLNVGDCVPFYFCPRSIMLYVIHCANHPELAYRGGQQPIVHLEVRSAPGRAMGASEWSTLGILAVQRGSGIYTVPRAAGATGRDQLGQRRCDRFSPGGYQGSQAGRVPRPGIVFLAPRRADRRAFSKYRAEGGERHAGRGASTNDRNPPRMVLLRGGRQ